MSAGLTLVLVVVVLVALTPLREVPRKLPRGVPGRLVESLSRRGGAATFAATLLALLVWWRARADGAIAAAAGRDFAPWLAQLEGSTIEALQHTLGPHITAAAAAFTAAAPLALVIGSALAPSRAEEPRVGVWILWAAAAITLPLSALVPLADPAESRLLELALFERSPFDATRDALLHLPIVAAVAASLWSWRRGRRRPAVVFAIGAVAFAASAVASGALWLLSMLASFAAGAIAERTARAAIALRHGEPVRT